MCNPTFASNVRVEHPQNKLGGFLAVRQFCRLEIQRDAGLIVTRIHQPTTTADELPVLIAQHCLMV